MNNDLVKEFLIQLTNILIEQYNVSFSYKANKHNNTRLNIFIPDVEYTISLVFFNSSKNFLSKEVDVYFDNKKVFECNLNDESVETDLINFILFILKQQKKIS